jgi:hypothetical protein
LAPHIPDPADAAVYNRQRSVPIQTAGTFSRPKNLVVNRQPDLFWFLASTQAVLCTPQDL